MTITAQKASDLAPEQRADIRIKLRLEGKLFVPAEEITLDCIIMDLSGGGAGIHCEEPPPLNTFVVLYVNGFGRFEGVATRYLKGELGLRFVCKEANGRQRAGPALPQEPARTAHSGPGMRRWRTRNSACAPHLKSRHRPGCRLHSGRSGGSAGDETAADEAFQISQLQYRQGVTELINVLQAQQQLFSAQDHLVQTVLSKPAGGHPSL